jgi:hypothetical protein
VDAVARASGKVAIDSNGNMVFAWTDNRTGSNHVYFRRFDISENPLNTDTMVDQGTGAGGASISPLPGGGFVIGYKDTSGLVGSVSARIYDSSGTPLGNAFRVDQNPDVNSNCGGKSTGVLATSPAGQIYFAWLDMRNTCNPSYPTDIYARIFDSSGNPIGNDFLVDQSPEIDNAIILGDIAAAPNGNFVIDDYREEGLISPRTDIFARAFDSSGIALGNDFKVNTETVEWTAMSPSVAYSAMGKGIIVWADGRSTNPGIYGRHIDINGNLTDADFKIGSVNGGIPKVAPVGNFSFVTAWLDTRTGPQQVWANITGPDSGIPLASDIFLGFIGIAFLILLSLFTKKFRVAASGR